MNGVNRFAIAILMMLSGYWTVVAQQQVSNPDKKNAVLLSGGAFMVSQKGLAPERVAEFRPAADLSYHRMLGEKWGIGVGYAYSESNPNYCHVDRPKDSFFYRYDCTQWNHSCLIAPDYYLNFNRFMVIPYVAMGITLTKITFFLYDVRTVKQTCLMLSPGIRVGYHLGHCMPFASYHLDYCLSSIDFPYITMDSGYKSYSHGHHCLKLGIGYLF